MGSSHLTILIVIIFIIIITFFALDTLIAYGGCWTGMHCPCYHWQENRLKLEENQDIILPSDTYFFFEENEDVLQRPFIARCQLQQQ